MRVWIRQFHNSFIEHSYRYGEAKVDKEAKRVTILCLETENVLIDCSESFFNKEVEKGRIIKVDNVI